MKRCGTVAVLLVLAGCGGGSDDGFDEDAVRANLEMRYPAAGPAKVDAAVDAMRDMCNTDDAAFEIVLAMASADDADVGIDDLERACPERTRQALAD